MISGDLAINIWCYATVLMHVHAGPVGEWFTHPRWRLSFDVFPRLFLDFIDNWLPWAYYTSSVRIQVIVGRISISANNIIFISFPSQQSACQQSNTVNAAWMWVTVVKVLTKPLALVIAVAKCIITILIHLIKLDNNWIVLIWIKLDCNEI